MAPDPTRVTESWLRQQCRGSPAHLTPQTAYQVACELKNLAPWWLRPEVLQQAAAHAAQIGLKAAAQRWQRKPQLPTDPGACWIALVNKYPEQFGLLRPAYALPLRWERGCQHDPRLPAGLLALANKVHSELERLGELSEQWGLLPASEALLCELDLGTLEGRWDSGFAPLAVGLLLATWEGQPDPALWASGGWVDGQGIQPVQALNQKIDLACTFRAKSFFVPESQAEDLRRWAQSQSLAVTIGTLRQNAPDLREALGDYLEQLELPIGPGPRLRSQRAEHFRRIQDRTTAERFYRKHLLPDLARELRQRLPPDLLSAGKKLITIVSKGYDLVRLAVHLIQPTGCLLLHDAELAAEASQTKAMLQQEIPTSRPTVCLVQGRTREELLTAFRRPIEQFAPHDRPEDLVFDLTGGKRIMNLALYDAAPPGSYALCIKSDFDPQSRRPVPYTEQIETWPIPAHRPP